MQTIGTFGFVARKWSCLALALSLALPAFGAQIVEQTLPLLRTRTGTYTNVTVTTRAKDYIVIMHSAGMTSIKVHDLDSEFQQRLGYAAATEKPPAKGTIAKITAQTMPAITEKLKPLETSWRDMLRKNQDRFQISAVAAWLILGAVLLMYLFFCYCCHLICIKTNAPPSALVWLPVLKWIPLLRSAGMSGWWFLGLFVPVLNIVAGVLWSLNIVKAREKNIWVAIGLLVPGVSLFAFLYLAFSSSALKLEAPHYQSMALQTA